MNLDQIDLHYSTKSKKKGVTLSLYQAVKIPVLSV